MRFDFASREYAHWLPQLDSPRSSDWAFLSFPLVPMSNLYHVRLQYGVSGRRARVRVRMGEI